MGFHNILSGMISYISLVYHLRIICIRNYLMGKMCIGLTVIQNNVYMTDHNSHTLFCCLKYIHKGKKICRLSPLKINFASKRDINHILGLNSLDIELNRFHKFELMFDNIGWIYKSTGKNLRSGYTLDNIYYNLKMSCIKHKKG